MKKSRLISFTEKHGQINGESYLMCFLKFEIVILKFFKYYKTIRYDLTMFDDWKSYKEYWNELINSNQTIDNSIIKNKIIFK